MHESLALADHTSTKTTKTHYIRSTIEPNPTK